MIEKELVAYLKLVHGLFNSLVFLLFCYQGWMGWRIRRSRQAGGPPSFAVVKRHRKTGPVFAGLGIMGYLFGLVLGWLNHNLNLNYRHTIHLPVGTVLAVAIVLAFLASRGIKSPDSSWRTHHFLLGLLLLSLYFFQVIIGLGILL